MKRTPAVSQSKELKKVNSSSMINKSQVQDSELASFDRLESIHFESHELESQIETLLTKMNESINFQTHFKSEPGVIKMKKDDFVSYYNNLKEIYKSFKKLAISWDSLYEDISNKHTQVLARKNKEIETLNKQYTYSMKVMELEKKSALENQRNEFFKREQELLDSVNNFTNMIKGTKKSWEDNMTELDLLLQEQKQNINYFANHKTQKIHALEEEIERILSQFSPTKMPGNTSRDQLSSARSRINPEKINKHFENFASILSPIEHPKGHLRQPSKEEMEALSRRSKLDPVADNSYEELLLLSKSPNDPPPEENYPDNSRISMVKNEGGWDSQLEDDESSENSEVDKVEKALALLYRNGMLEPQSLEMYENIIETTKESTIDREIKMNLLKDYIKLQMKKQKKVEKNMDLPMNIEKKKKKNKGEASSYKKKNIDKLNIDDSQINPELACTTPSHQRLKFKKSGENSGEQSSGLEKTINQSETNPHKNSNKNPHVHLIKKGEKKTDISLSDLLGVKEHSFELQSPLSSHRSRPQTPAIRNVVLHHVDKEEILKADSFPVEIKTLKELEILPEIENANLEGSIMNRSSHNTKRGSDKENKQNWNQSKIKIIDDFKQSQGLSQKFSKQQSCESGDTSEDDTQYISSFKRKLLYQDDMQLDSETNLDSRDDHRPSHHYKSNMHAITDRVPDHKKDSIFNTPTPGKQAKDKAPLYERADDFGQKAKKIVSISPSQTNRSDAKLSPSSLLKNSELFRKNKLTNSNIMKKMTKNNSFRTSCFINSNPLPNFTTNQYTLPGAEGNIHHVQMTMYHDLINTEPCINIPEKAGHNFSKLVATTIDESYPLSLNHSFPPYSERKKEYKKEMKILLPKRNGHYMSMKSNETADTAFGLKNLSSNTNLSNVNIASLKEGRTFSSHHTRSMNHIYAKGRILGGERPYSPHLVNNI